LAGSSQPIDHKGINPTAQFTREIASIPDGLDQEWARVLAFLRGEVGEAAAHNWLDCLSVVALS